MITTRGAVQKSVTTEPMTAPTMLNMDDGPGVPSVMGMFEVMPIHDTTQKTPKPTTYTNPTQVTTSRAVRPQR